MLELLQQVYRQVRGYMHSDAFNRQGVFLSSSEHTTMQFDHEAEDIIISGLVENVSVTSETDGTHVRMTWPATDVLAPAFE